MNAFFRRVMSPAVLVWVVAHGATAPAITTNWNTTSDGNFNIAANWTNGVPGDADTAVFHQGVAANYTVTLNGGPPQLPPVVHTVDRLVVDANTVFLDRNPILGATSLVAENATEAESGRGIAIGELAGEHSSLTTTIPVTAVAATLGDTANSQGLWDVHSSTLTLTGAINSLLVGNNGSGTLGINSGGVVNFTNSNALVTIANHLGASGTLTVAGTNSKFIGDETRLYVGGAGSGALNVVDGGLLSAVSVTAPIETGSGTITVNNAQVQLSQDLDIGKEGVANFGNAELDIGAGGQVQSRFGIIAGGAGKSSVAHVVGAGAMWTMSSNLIVGQAVVGVPNGISTSQLTIEAGGAVSNGNATVASPADSICQVDVFGGTWTNNGSLGIAGDVNSDTSFGAGAVRVLPQGNVSVAGDTTLFPGGSLLLSGGTLDAQHVNFKVGSSFQWLSGTLHVTVFNSDLNTPSFGVLAPGHDKSPGSTTVVGNYSQAAGGHLQMEIGGRAPGASSDLLGVTGHAVLDGQLDVSMLFGFVPSPTDTFTILNTGGGVFGIFSNIASGQRMMTTDGRGSFIVNYGAGSAFNQNQVILSDFQPTILAGDFDHNGIVDAADYTLWCDTFGQTGPNLPADGDGNLVVDDNDFAIWKSNFGAHFGSGAGSGGVDLAVPEPTATGLAVEAIACIVVLALIAKCRSEVNTPTRNDMSQPYCSFAA